MSMKRHIALIISLLCLATVPSLAQGYVPAAVEITTEKVKLNGKVYYAHLVQERQTLYGIAKAYGVTEEVLHEANPSLRETGLQKSTILLIPVDKAVPGRSEEETKKAIESPEEQKGYKEHTVRWYEDIDDIARRYNVSPEDIMKFNGLKDRKLKTRQVLRIPLAAKTPAPLDIQPDTPEVETVQADTLVAVAGPQEGLASAPEVADSVLIETRSRDYVEFSLLLPLNASGKTSELNMDFYSGVLMALRDLEADGLKIKMNTFDLYAGMPSIDVLSGGDFVLGPIASRDLEAVLSRIDGSVPVISPLDQKAGSLSADYRNFIQAPSGVDNQYEDLGEWLLENNAEGDKIIFVSQKNAASAQASIGIRSALARRELTYDILSYGMSEGQRVPTIIAPLLVKERVNRVVVASENEAFVGDVVRNLSIMAGKGYKIEMYAPSKVKNFESIDGSSLHDLSAHISTAYHVEYGSKGVEDFVHAYRALFRTEPSQFAFQGYDTARYFILRVARYSSGWQNYLGRDRSRGLHTDFLFDEDENGNRHNVAVRRVIYNPDYTTSLQWKQ